MSQQESEQHPPIRCAEVYPLDREQWTGYCTAYVALPSGERAVFVTICAGFIKPEGEIAESFQTREEAAWKAFDLGLRDWLKDHPGVVLWRLEPTLRTETQDVLDTFAGREPRLIRETRYAIVARLAVTENRDFLDPAKFAPLASVVVPA